MPFFFFVLFFLSLYFQSMDTKNEDYELITDSDEEEEEDFDIIMVEEEKENVYTLYESMGLLIETMFVTLIPRMIHVLMSF